MEGIVTEFQEQVRERYTDNPTHLRQQAGALRRIAASMQGLKDENGNTSSSFGGMARRAELRAASIDAQGVTK